MENPDLGKLNLQTADGIEARGGDRINQERIGELQDGRSIKIDLAQYRQGLGDAKTARGTPAEPSWAKV